MPKTPVIIFILCFCLVACGQKSAKQQLPQFSGFEDCFKAGNRILESYPRQCQTQDGQSFVEELTDLEKDKLKTNMPNPASVFCVEQGGSLEIETDGQGSLGLCKFADGTKCEEWAFYRGECASDKTKKQLGEDASLEVAKIWVLTKSPTYTFDGSQLLYEQTQAQNCPDCYQFIFSFESSRAGFGDRAGLAAAQVVTPHVIVINVEKGRVISAVTDNQYDEIRDQIIKTAK